MIHTSCLRSHSSSQNHVRPTARNAANRATPPTVPYPKQATRVWSTTCIDRRCHPWSGRVQVGADLAEPAGVVAGGQEAWDEAGHGGAVAVVVLAAGLPGYHGRLARPGPLEAAQRFFGAGARPGGVPEGGGERPGVL